MNQWQGEKRVSKPNTVRPQPLYVRPIDQQVLEVLRRSPAMSIRQLVAELDVTATAIRQRLERLERSGFVEKQKRVSGRGRPVYLYSITQQGARFAGVDYAELAAALWQELLEIDDASLRMKILHAVARRLGRELHSEQSEASDLNGRMTAAAEQLARRRVSVDVSADGELPVLEVQCCPYPDLVGAGEERPLCELEEVMLSEAVGEELHLYQCRLDGHSCCQFRPVAKAADTASMP